MKDLKHQLAEALGVEPPSEERPVLSDPVPREPLAEDAHLDSAWHQRLVELARGFSIQLAARPKLGQARQASDQLVKLLKKAGRGRDAKELAKLRDAFMARRDKAAWAAVKERFAALELSDKAFRSVKQSKADPTRVLGLIDNSGESLRGASAKKARALLTRS